MENPAPPPPPPPLSPPPPRGSGPRVSRDEVKDLGRLRRSVTDRRISGVAGGLARHLDVDPILVRVAFVVAAFFGGAGLLAYVGIWILVPDEGTDDEPLGLDHRNRSIALIGVGVLSLLCAVGDWAGAFWFPWPLAIVAAVAVWLLNRHSNREQPLPPYAQQEYAQQEYAQPDYTQQEYAQQDYTRRPRPGSARRRGPILFFFTLALIALAEGVLGVIDLAGADIPASAYPALALGFTAALLLIGSVWGRAGGLIALGLVAALATGATTAGSHISHDTVVHAPLSASQVQDSYDLGGGELVVDLSGIDDVTELQGRSIAIDGVGGRVEVIVPSNIGVAVQTQVVAGQSQVFDQSQAGFDVNLDARRNTIEGFPGLSISIDLVAGEIIVRKAT